jgi:hypothetical protein
LDDGNRTVLASYVCGELAAISQELFGDEGRYRALHVLVDVSAGGPVDGTFRPAPPGDPAPEYAGAELLQPGTFVSRLYERSPHGAGLLPYGTAEVSAEFDPVASCETIANALLQDALNGSDTYPDRYAIPLQTATHRWYHQYTDQETIEIGGQNRPVGLTLPNWATAATEGADADVSLYGAESRAPISFPYGQVFLSTQPTPLPLEACPDLTSVVGVLWAELGNLGGKYGEDPSDTCIDSVHPGCWPSTPASGCSAGGPTAPAWLALLLSAMAAISLARP